LPKVAALLEEAEEDLLAFYRFPSDHWPKLRSTNPLERVNREIGRRYLSAHSLEPLLAHGNPDQEQEQESKKVLAFTTA
jgi:hypothetical protein